MDAGPDAVQPVPAASGTGVLDHRSRGFRPRTRDALMGMSRCRACRSDQLEPVLDLGASPAANTFPAVDDPEPDPTWPLRLYACGRCALVQLGDDAPAEPITARTGLTSTTMREHARAFVATLVA